MKLNLKPGQKVLLCNGTIETLLEVRGERTWWVQPKKSLGSYIYKEDIRRIVSEPLTLSTHAGGLMFIR